jgi:tetratricopeptide (TPR) repeat protein
MLRPFVFLTLLWASSYSFAFATSDKWLEVSSPHFTVITDSTDQQGRHILDQFERLRWMFQTLFPKTKAGAALPIIILAVKNQTGFQLLEPAAYLAKGQPTLAGLFLSTLDKNYVLLRLDAADDHPFASIYHDYTRLQFSGALEWIPLWLSEGFAKFFQNTEIRDKDVLLGHANADDILFLRQNQLLPLATLFKVDADSPYYHEEQRASVFCAEAWALTHYLEITDHEKGTNQLQDYMSLVSQQQDPVEAAETAFGDLKKLQAALESYIQTGSYKQFVLSSAAAPLDEASYKSMPLTRAQADAIRADFLAYAQRAQDAQTLLATVFKSDPRNAQAFETMGYLASQNGDKETARKWYGLAVRLDPESFLANYYFAVMSMNGGIPPNSAEVESSLRAAIRLSPNFAPAYDQLASFLAMRHTHLEEAHGLSLFAIRLDPRNLAYRLNAATVLMTMSKYEEAAGVLRNSMDVPKNPSEVALLQNRLKEIVSIQALSTKPSAMITAPPSAPVIIQTAEEVEAVALAPKHSTETPNGPKHVAIGVIRGVQCSIPAEIEFRVETANEPVSLYSNNFLKIDLTVLGFSPKGEMNPCKDFEGMKARVQYAESSDKTVDGQVIAVELRK